MMNKVIAQAIEDFFTQYMNAHDPEEILDEIINGDLLGDVADDERTSEVAEQIEHYLAHTLNSRNDYVKLTELTSVYAYENQRQGFLWGVQFMRKLMTGELEE